MDMVTKYFVTMINTANLCKFIEEKMQFINSWKRCFKKSKIAKTQQKNISEKNSKLLKKMRKTSNKQKNATFVAKHTQRKTKYSEITVISQENTEDLHIQIVTSIISD